MINLFDAPGALCKDSCMIGIPSEYVTPNQVYVDGRASTAPEEVKVWLKDGTYVVISIADGSIHIRKPDASSINIDSSEDYSEPDTMHPPIHLLKSLKEKSPF